jgi:uncharacterized protein (TIGR00299 family) protein
MIAYLDLPSGLSGDMLLGCLVDAGWPTDRLRAAIQSLSLPTTEWAISVERVSRHSLAATKVDVLADEGRHQRRLADVMQIIQASTLPPVVKQRSIAVFQRLANAEAAVHGTTPDQIHFHEVGAVDAIIDIVASIAGLHELSIAALHASPLPLGPGWTDSAHGKLPLPAPATLQLLSAVNAPTRPAPGPGELLTPTAAALLAELATFTQPAMTISRIGTGAGTKDFPWPNIARLWLGEPVASRPEPSQPPALIQLETNIDDMNPQLYAGVIENLLAAGAKDAWLTPVQMKKGRPGVVLAALASTADEAALVELMLRETTTLGVRVHAVHHRHEARRELREVPTAYGTVGIKVKWIGPEPVGAMPEFEDCRLRAQTAGQPVRVVYDAAVAAAAHLLTQLRVQAEPMRI